MEQKNKLILKPSKKQFEELEKGLKTEFETFQTGFYINWNIIENCYKNDNLILFKQDSKIIGFVVPSIDEIILSIEIFQILKPYENNGLGTLFFTLFSEYSIQQKAKVFYLNCSPEESEFFWRKQGFLPLEVLGLNILRLSFYKPLLDVSIPSKESDSVNKIEIWDSSVDASENKPPRWVFETEKGFKPILLPVHYKWKMKWTKNGIIQYEDEMKYFSNKVEIIFSPFVFIEKLPE